jgi:hypothetical protein
MCFDTLDCTFVSLLIYFKVVHLVLSYLSPSLISNLPTELYARKHALARRIL